MLKRGFTLIELIVAMGLLSVVLLAVFNTFTYQHETYTVVDQISEAQQNSQAIARLIERDLRNAGYMVPPGGASCGVDSTAAPDMLFVSDTDAILPADQLPVELAGKQLAAPADEADAPGSVGSQPMDVDDVVLDGVASYDTDADGTNDSDFRVGGGAILVDLGAPDRGVSCGIVEAVDTSAPFGVTVNFRTLLAAGTAQNLVLVPAHVYQVVSGPPPTLQRNGVLLAKDVEDFQVAWFYDDDQDGVVDTIPTNEVRGASGTTYATDAVVGEELREVRVNLVLRTRADDPRNPDNTGIGQQRENRTTSIAAADGKHRRVHTATVRLRNLTL